MIEFERPSRLSLPRPANRLFPIVASDLRQIVPSTNGTNPPMPSLHTDDKTELPVVLAGSNVFTGKAVFVGKRLELGEFTQTERIANL